jgi:hypothetical protein
MKKYGLLMILMVSCTDSNWRFITTQNPAVKNNICPKFEAGVYRVIDPQSQYFNCEGIIPNEGFMPVETGECFVLFSGSTNHCTLSGFQRIGIKQVKKINNIPLKPI